MATYLIWSFEHGKWWGAAEWGYTEDVAKAGRYTLAKAIEIVARANLVKLNEAIVPTPERKPAGEPGYWLYETSGVLRPAIEAYLAGGELSAEHVAAMRAYIRQWIGSKAWDANPFAGPRDRACLAELRAAVDGLTSRTAIAAWLDKAEKAGIDPL